MSEFVTIVVIIALVLAFLARRGNQRSFGGDSDNKGCRDCQACLRPLIQRFFINATWGNVRGIFVMFVSTCPQCGHAASKHGKRDDGSYLD